MNSEPPTVNSQPPTLPKGYRWVKGSGKDRSLLVEFITDTYQELFPQQTNFAHLAQTIQQYFSSETPLWWVYSEQEAIACLWLGIGVDQSNGDRYTHVFLIYVAPEHREQGIGTNLMIQTQTWAKARGDRQIGLQVFDHNKAALSLYNRMGYKTRSRLMIKQL